jgi:hypothetical protein
MAAAAVPAGPRRGILHRQRWGAVRCVARGNIIALANTHEESEARRAIKHEVRSSMDFYWSRDKQWPFARARLALISPPRGGFPTSYAVDPVPKSSSAPR